MKTSQKIAKFDCSKAEFEIIRRIVARMGEMCQKEGFPFEHRDSLMDIEACHCSGNPLDLEKLLRAPDSDFGHDVFGIRRYLNRSTGELTQCFSPRCSLPEVSTKEIKDWLVSIA